VIGTIRRYAQELGEDVIWPYVELYVTEHTVDLGDDGIRALERLERTAAAAGALPAGAAPLRVLGRASGAAAARPAESGRRTTAPAGSAARLR
jgi:hypothetical protein